MKDPVRLRIDRSRCESSVEFRKCVTLARTAHGNLLLALRYPENEEQVAVRRASYAAIRWALEELDVLEDELEPFREGFGSPGEREKVEG